MGHSNGLTNRIGVLGLALVAPASIVCATVIIGIGRELPQGYWTATAAAVAALAGLMQCPRDHVK